MTSASHRSAATHVAAAHEHVTPISAEPGASTEVPTAVPAGTAPVQDAPVWSLGAAIAAGLLALGAAVAATPRKLQARR